uniref:CCHC-type domain-containing protein n=1 Tax=Poecilia formosa TaxID=48698 RepID=A0A096LW99_POEFO
RRNVIFERAKFNQRQQETGESIDGFHTALHCLAEYCGYGTLHDEMVRDRFVVGLRDRLSEQLQMDAELTPEKVLNGALQSELVKKQQEMLHVRHCWSAVGPRSRSGSARSRQPKAPHKHLVTKATQDKKAQCRRCGDTKGPSMQQCPARESACNYCGKKGHFARVCRNKKICEVNAGFATESTDTDIDIAFLGSLSAEVKDNPWMTDILVDKHKTVFKIDTGADVTAVPETLYSRYQFGKLDKPKKILQGPGGTRLKVKGMFTATLSNNSVCTKEGIYIVKDLCTTLLSGRAAMALKLVDRLNQISLVSIDAVKQEFAKFFTGLGLMEGEYNVALSPDAQPFSLSTLRRISNRLCFGISSVCHALPETHDTDSGGPRSGVSKLFAKRARFGVLKMSGADLGGRSLHRTAIYLNAFQQAILFYICFFNFNFSDLQFLKVYYSEVKTENFSEFMTYFIFIQRLILNVASRIEPKWDAICSVFYKYVRAAPVIVSLTVLQYYVQLPQSQCVSSALKQEANATLNYKCGFSKCRPRNISEVRRFLGMVNHLGKFLPHLAEKTRPLRDLLKKSNMWSWGHHSAFNAIKIDLTTPPGLALSDPNAETRVSADASLYGLGADLQKHTDTGWKPVAYASRSLSGTEQRYDEIEKEALASTWACERFAEFLIRKSFHIETDHKPLVPLLGSKSLNELPLRIQQLQMRLMRFSYSISHVAGKNITTDDALSRAPIFSESGVQEEEVNLYVDSVVACLTATEPQLWE